jgi:hypothetical protein
LQKAGVLLEIKRCPMADNEIIEIRRVQEFADFPADIQKADAGSPNASGRQAQKNGVNQLSPSRIACQRAKTQ